jgi:hypothetical protein
MYSEINLIRSFLKLPVFEFYFNFIATLLFSFYYVHTLDISYASTELFCIYKSCECQYMFISIIVYAQKFFATNVSNYHDY